MADVAIPEGSTILVTGVNGYIGAHVANQILSAGYKVRGTARSSEKADWCREYFHETYGPDSFEAVVVEDMARDGAFDEAMKGCAGVAHVASDMTFRPNPDEVIPPVLQGVKNVLRAAAAHPEIKRFVLTSSSSAATLPKPNKEFTIDSTSWNTEAVQIAHAPPPYNEERAFTVYAASKTEGEMACWEFMRSETPQFVFNAVLPNYNMGKFLHEKQPGSTGGFVRGLYNNDEGAINFLKNFDPQYMVDVQDVGRLHVAGLLYPDVQNERLLAFTEPFNFNELVRTMKKISPDKSLPDEVDGIGRDLSTVDTSRSEELLKRMGRDGFTPMEQSIRECVAA